MGVEAGVPTLVMAGSLETGHPGRQSVVSGGIGGEGRSERRAGVGLADGSLSVVSR